MLGGWVTYDGQAAHPGDVHAVRILATHILKFTTDYTPKGFYFHPPVNLTFHVLAG